MSQCRCASLFGSRSGTRLSNLFGSRCCLGCVRNGRGPGDRIVTEPNRASRCAEIYSSQFDGRISLGTRTRRLGNRVLSERGLHRTPAWICAWGFSSPSDPCRLRTSGGSRLLGMESRVADRSGSHRIRRIPSAPSVGGGCSRGRVGYCFWGVVVGGDGFGPVRSQVHPAMAPLCLAPGISRTPSSPEPDGFSHYLGGSRYFPPSDLATHAGCPLDPTFPGRQRDSAQYHSL